jgi:hypothetical protein
MKTEQEILDRIEAIKKDDFFGSQSQELISYLSFDNAKPYLVEGTKAQDWKPRENAPDAIKGEMRGYLSFAWEKANDQRGLSASRSIDHMRAFLWLLGEDTLLERMDTAYEFYGKPCLVLCSELCGFDWRAHDDGCWSNNEGDEGTTAERGLARHGITLSVAA